MGEVGQVLRGGGLGWGLVLVTVASQASRDPVAGVGVSRRRWGWVGGWATSGVGVSLWFWLRKQQVSGQPLQQPLRVPTPSQTPRTHPPRGTKESAVLTFGKNYQIPLPFAISHFSFFKKNIIPNILGGL